MVPAFAEGTLEARTPQPLITAMTRAHSMNGWSSLGNCALFLGAAVAMLAVFGPFHAFAERYFSAHMLQHMVLMDLAAPLLACGLAGRAPMGGVSAGVAAVLHGIVLWGWHVPVIFSAAGDDALAHPLMHATFLGAGLLFWRTSLRSTDGAAVFWMFVTVMHSGLLGALITFAPTSVYRIAGTAIDVADQQAAGLLMWVGGTAIYTLAGVLLAGRWLKRLEERA